MICNKMSLTEEEWDWVKNLPESKGFVDVHCHLIAEEFDEDRDHIINEAITEGVTAIVVVAEGDEQFQKILDWQKRYPEFIFPCLGYHPVQGDYSNASLASSLTTSALTSLKFIEENIENLVGIGEIGLDFTPKFTKNGAEDREKQKEALMLQVDLADEFNLPINLHSRSAGRPLFELLNSRNKVTPAVFHAYSGKTSLMKHVCKQRENWYFTFGTNRVTDSDLNQKYAKDIPIKNVLLETDAPALGVDRGKRNEPKELIRAAETFAARRNIKLNDVKNITSYNAVKLFPKLKSVLF